MLVDSLRLFKITHLYAIYHNILYRQVAGLPMATICAPLVADLFLYCYERNFMLSLKPDTHAEFVNALFGRYS